MQSEDHNATTYTPSSLPTCSPVYRIGKVYMAGILNTVWVKRTSTLLLLYSLSLRAVASPLSLNSTPSGANRVKTACRSTAIWKTPEWTSRVSYYCQRVIETLEIIEPESLSYDVTFGHQFLPPGQDPQYPTSQAVRTPWKLTIGMSSCLILPLLSS